MQRLLKLTETARYYQCLLDFSPSHLKRA